MSDRICIHSNASRIVSVSAEDLIECCTTCGDGCGGGYSTKGWLHWQNIGIVTGGAFNTLEVFYSPNFKKFLKCTLRDAKIIKFLHAIIMLSAHYLHVVALFQHLPV